MNTTDLIIYKIGWIFLTGFLLAGILQRCNVFTLTDLGLPCAFRMATGHFCPGCGGTHAVCALIQGNLSVSFHMHAVVPYAFFLLIIYLGWNTVAAIFNNKIDSVKLPAFHFHTAYVYIALAIIFIQWILRLTGHFLPSL